MPRTGADARAATFLISRLALEEVRGTASRATVTGFDLDGVRSNGAGETCVEVNPDYVLEPDGDLGGIDNAMATLVPTMEEVIDEVVERDDPLGLDAALADERIVLLLRLLPSETEPPSDPTLQVFRGMPVDGGIVRDASGRPVHGQLFRGELVAEGPFASDGARRGAAIVPAFAPTLVDPSPAPPLDLARVTHVGLDFCRGLGLRGRIGGTWTPEAGGTWFRRLGLDGNADTATTVVANVADLDPDPDDPARCRRVSLGLAFEVVTAVLVDE